MSVPPPPTPPAALLSSSLSASSKAAEPRDYQSERDALLRRAEALQAEMSATDLDAAASAALASVAAQSRSALASSESSSRRAHDKVMLAQERFKAECQASGISLELEVCSAHES